MLLRNIDVSLLELAQDPTRARDFLRGMRHPRHLAATAVVTAEGAIFGIRRRRACLGMPTDGGRRNTLWRCTNVWMWQ